MKWYQTNFNRWLDEKQIARKILKEVEDYIDVQGRACLSGVLQLNTEHGRKIDAFRIRIVYPDDFFNSADPSVYLLSHRSKWKNTPDSHIEGDWRLCLYVPFESAIDFSKSDSLKELLKCIGVFLYKETLYQRDLRSSRITGVPPKWPGEDRSHGVEGIKEAARTILSK